MTGYFTAPAAQGTAVEKRGCQTSRKQKLIFCCLPSLSSLSAASGTHGPLQDLLQTGIPQPAADDVVALEVRGVGDRGDTRRALTAI